MRKILVSLLLVVLSFTAWANETKQDSIVLEDNSTFASQMITKASGIVQATVKMVTAPLSMSKKDIDCLAHNIYHEAGNESEEGKVAVAIVTLNRANDSRFGASVCEVVKARTVLVKTKEVKRTEVVAAGFFSRPKEVTSTVTVTEKVPVCQFSWVCNIVRKPKENDERWVKSQEVAYNIAAGEYDDYREKYRSALFFHSTRIRPAWAKQKHYVARVGGHIFYE